MKVMICHMKKKAANEGIYENTFINTTLKLKLRLNEMQ